MSYPLRSCHRCGKGFFSSYKEHICQDCLNDLGWEPTPYTNADHIRYITDEELAEFVLACDLGFLPWCDRHCEFKGDNGCDKCITNWLKQPYEDGDNG